jgi:hypothetical protein
MFTIQLVTDRQAAFHEKSHATPHDMGGVRSARRRLAKAPLFVTLIEQE